MRMGEKAPPATKDFYGRPVESLIPMSLPETMGIPCKTTLPSAGDRIRTKDGREGTVEEVGELAHFGNRYRSIGTRFDCGDRWFICVDDIDDHWTP